MFDFAAIKAQARQTVHETFAVPASYVAPDGTPWTGGEIDVRWANKLGLNGDLSGEYTAVLEGIDRLVFNSANLADIGLTIARHARVTLPAYGRTFELDTPSPANGPLHIYWNVVDAAA